MTLRGWGTVLLAGVLFVLLLASLFLLSYATEQSGRFENLYEWMLLVNAGGLLVLSTLIGINLLRLIRQYRANTVGSRLTVRMLALFLVLAVVPVTLVYYFSLQFLQRGIDSWFDVEVEKALEDSLQLSQAALDLRKRALLNRTVQMAEALDAEPQADPALALNEMRDLSDASELTLFGHNGRIIAFSSAEAGAVLPSSPPDDMSVQLRRGQPYVALEPLFERGLQIRVAVPLRGGPDQSLMLQALYAVPQHLNELADGVQLSFAQYKRLAFQRTPLKKSFLLSLSLVLLLSLLAAVWAAFYTTRRLVAPVRDLAEGTRAVAEGNYSTRLPPAGHDELGFLVNSFNDMTSRIAQASAETLRSRQQAEEHRAYLEAVLANLSSGVLTLDADQQLRTANAAAEHILGAPLREFIDQPWMRVVAAFPYLQRLGDMWSPHLQARAANWSEEVVLFAQAGRRILICRGSNLDVEGRKGDHVVVFDDITTLVQAQRDAAWGEVARRLAHEIKNPLTPIQLSAERLRRKYLGSLPPEDAELLDRSTHTIVQQVEAMKEMVNAFTEYARAPMLSPEPLDFNQLVREVVDLYSGAHIDLSLTGRSPQVMADSGRLRQVLHNLIKNALEAHGRTTPARIEISTRCIDEHGCSGLELSVRDFGPGFPEALMGQYFEPYFTTKPKGTGLGLAIVKKIVEEHGGMVKAENVNPGARIEIRLPVIGATELGTPQTSSVQAPEQYHS